MLDRLTLPPTARRILELARTDRAQATRAIDELPPDAQVGLVCEMPLAHRAELLGLLSKPEEVIPRLPEAELCFTIKAIGISDSAWILELASEEQLVACLDLDAWKGAAPERAALDEWMNALAEAESGALLRALRALDPELLIHFLNGRIAVIQKPPDDEGWQPPKGSHTLEGQFHFVALAEGDDLAPVVAMLRVLFERDYWTYFRVMQGVIWEFEAENEEWANRWRAGRLLDLGFPSWDEAMRIYGHLAPGALAAIPEDAHPFDVSEWHLPVWMPRLPTEAESQHLVFRAIAGLEADERRASFYAFVALANRVAVADRMALGDAESTPRAIDKAARLASKGLEFVAKERGLEPVETLRRVPLERLFRVGANLDPESARS